MPIYSSLLLIAMLFLLLPSISKQNPVSPNHNLTAQELHAVFANLSKKAIVGRYYTNKPSPESSLIQNKLFQFFSKKSGIASMKLFFLKNRAVILTFIISDGDYRNNFFSLSQSLNFKDMNYSYANNTSSQSGDLIIPSKSFMSYIKLFKAIFLRGKIKEDNVAVQLSISNSTQSVKASIAFGVIESNETHQINSEFSIECDLKIEEKRADAANALFTVSFILMTAFHLFTNCYMIYLGKTKKISFNGISFLFIHIDMIWNAIQCIFISNISSFLEFNTYGYGVIALIYFIIFGFVQSYLVYLMKKSQDASCRQLVHLFLFEFFASLFIFLYSFYYSFWKYLVHLIFPTTFLPQIIHNITAKVKRREVPIVAIVSFTLNKTFLFLNCFCVPHNAFQTKPEMLPFLYGFGIHMAQIGFLFIQWTYGYDFYLPRHMKNSIERYYRTYDESLAFNPNLFLDKCCICLFDLIPTPGGNDIDESIDPKRKKEPKKGSSVGYDEKIIGKDFSNVAYSSNMRELENRLETNPNDRRSSNANSNQSSCDISYSPSCKQGILSVNKEQRCTKMKNSCLVLVRCMAKRKYLVLTPCNHFFHPNCIEEWWKSKKECPFCRHPLPSFTEEDEEHYIIN